MGTLLKIGIVGFSRDQFDKKAASEILEKAFRELVEKHPETEIEIVSGYTNSGVPKIAYELADTFNFTTVGFSAKQALKVRSGVYSVSKVFIYGSKFGDESEQFVEYIDHLIRVGGGPQSREETRMFKELPHAKPLDEILQEFEIEWYGK